MRVLIASLSFLAVVSALPWDRVTRQADLTCSCGVWNRNRIVGGRETSVNEYPLMASMEVNGRHLCGGSIITPWHVLTAAHCTEGFTANQIVVSLGQHERNGQADQRVRVSRIIDHERYESSTFLNDISLLLTSSEIRFNRNVSPVCMPTRRLNQVGQRLTAIGWGNTANNGRLADRLQHVDLTVISFERCLDLHSRVRIRPNQATNVCTLESQKDTCQGDSGGPLVFLDAQTNRLTQAALVSFGGACAGSMPAVNTDVSAYIDWINRNVAASRQGARTCQRAN